MILVYAVLDFTGPTSAATNLCLGTGWFYQSWGSGYAYSDLSLPHGTRVCVEWKESGSPVGGEPCITIKR